MNRVDAIPSLLDVAKRAKEAGFDLQMSELEFAHKASKVIGDGSFRWLIYDYMGYGVDAYSALYSAGLMDVNNEDWSGK